MYPRRLLVMSEPPSIDANEITDKGYMNQRAVLERRAALVEKLYGESADVIHRDYSPPSQAIAPTVTNAPTTCALSVWPRKSHRATAARSARS